jgi:hypothetical protein
MLQSLNNNNSLAKTSILTAQNNQPANINQNGKPLAYVGITLKEYFRISDKKYQLDEIDEENNSEVEEGTPCFGED